MKFLFLILKYATMKFLRTFFISFVVFGAAVYRPSSMVDYTERRKTERKKVNVSPLHHRRPYTERRSIKRKKNETVFKFHESMPQ